MKEKINKLEIKLRKNIELNEQSQDAKKQSHAKSDIRDVIRRRKGEPDKRIPLNVNREQINNSTFGIHDSAKK